MIRKPVSFVVIFAAVVAAGAALGVAAWGPAPEPGPGPDPDPVAFSAFGNDGGFTDLADELNGLIMNSYVACGADAYGEGAYNCGFNTGVMIRVPDFIQGTGTAVVPASIIHNDIAAPNVVYPAVGDPWCENYGTDGIFTPAALDCATKNGYSAWTTPSLGVIIGKEGMATLYPDFDNVQSDDWGWGSSTLPTPILLIKGVGIWRIRGTATVPYTTAPKESLYLLTDRFTTTSLERTLVQAIMRWAIRELASAAAALAAISTKVLPV